MLRFVGALRDAKICTPCHERNDFQPGRLRGGMSVIVPLAPIWKMESSHRTITLALLGSLWIVGIGGIFLTHRGLTQRIKERDDAREESRRMTLEKSNAESALAASTEQLHQTEQHLQAEKLRAEIAGNLHDDIGTTLSSTSIFTELLNKELLNNASPRALKLLSRIKYNLLAVQLNMHDIVWAINPENDSLDAMLFKLQEYASDILDANGIALRCSIAPIAKPRLVPMNVRKELLLIFKEAFNNIVRHAQAHEVALTIRVAESALAVAIGDDGKGFSGKPNGEGNGLKNMKLRAEKLSGTLRISSRPGEGTLIEIELPLA
jgi:signal transduction histidine kinase